MADIELLIKIPEEEYERFKKNQKKEYSESMLDVNIIANGIPIPDNATNGDVIKAMFTNSEYEILDNTVITEIDNGLWFTLDWWNAPYQKGGK